MINYDNLLSKKAVSLKPSGIRKFFSLAETMEDVVALTIGQPDFVTPWHIRDAAIESLQNGKTYYTSNAGLTPLRKKICEYMDRRFGISYDYETETLVTVGGSEAIDIAVRAVVDAGDEVIIPEPCFVCYAPIVTMAGGIPVSLPLSSEDKFKLTPERLKSAITDKTKLLVLAYPNNPTGAIMTKSDLEKIADLLRDTDILVLSDEIYAELTYGKTHCSIASLDGMRERTVIASGFSKAYAMTGWRMGYTLAPARITEQMYKIHQFAIMCSPTTSQFAAVEALTNGDEDIEYMRSAYNDRRRLLLDGFKSIGLDCFEPEGAFYAFPNIGKFGMSSEDFCRELLYKKKVAIVPGTAFGESGEGFARVSYAYSPAHITTAIGKIGEFIKEL